MQEKYVCEQLSRLIPSSKLVGAYYPFASELDIRAIFSYYNLALPVVIGDEMEFVQYQVGDEMQQNSYGIIEPMQRNIVIPEILLIPALAYDKENYRLGYGGGYYDKYLAKYDIEAIGVAFSCQICEKLPHQEFDMKVDYVISQ